MMQKLFFCLMLTTIALTGCITSVPGVQNQSDGRFKVECSPFEEQVCQRKAEKKCTPNPIRVLGTQIVKKYSSSSVISDNAIGLNDHIGMQAPKHQIEVLVATFRCDTLPSNNE